MDSIQVLLQLSKAPLLGSPLFSSLPGPVWALADHSPCTRPSHAHQLFKLTPMGSSLPSPTVSDSSPWTQVLSPRQHTPFTLGVTLLRQLKSLLSLTAPSTPPGLVPRLWPLPWDKPTCLPLASPLYCCCRTSKTCRGPLCWFCS